MPSAIKICVSVSAYFSDYRQCAANCSVRFSFLNLFFCFGSTYTFGHTIESDEGYDEEDDLENQDGDGDVGSVVHRYSTSKLQCFNIFL